MSQAMGCDKKQGGSTGTCHLPALMYQFLHRHERVQIPGRFNSEPSTKPKNSDSHSILK
jgi:hypothetical protein